VDRGGDRWKRKPRLLDTVILGDWDDDNIVAFAEIVAFEGEWPEGKAVLKVDGGPYELFDGCDDRSTGEGHRHRGPVAMCRSGPTSLPL